MSKTPGSRTGLVSGLAALALVSSLAVAPAPVTGAPTGARPGKSRAARLGIPQAPRVLYAEDFENEMARAPVLLSKYQGAPPLSMTYGADPFFLKNCNGFIVEFESNERLLKTDCEEVAFNRVRQMAWVLGKLRGDPLANHAVSAYTDGKSILPADAVQFETLKPIPVAADGRFITFSVDSVETNCHRNHAELKFYLLDGALEIPTFTTPIDPCTDKRAQVLEPPKLGTATAEPFLTGTFAGNAATLFTGTSVGIRMRNGQTSETGNDAAFDNIEMLDATPQLDKSFSPEVLNVGGVSQLTYTITNTTELAAKEGWSFTDTLPAGLVVASPAMGSTTCATPTTIEAIAGSDKIAVKGSLAAEMPYCTVEVNVTSEKEGRYVNGPDDVTEIGIEPPGEAPVEFADNADLAIEKSVAPTPGTPGGEATFTLAVTNHGPDTAKGVLVADPIPAGLEFVSAQAPCAEAGGEVRCPLGSLAKGESVSLEFVVRIPASAEEGFVDTATVTSTTPDPDPSNNSDTAALPLFPEADLRIEKIALPDRLTAGGHVTYLLLVHNSGPSDATDVTVTDPVPAAIRLLAAHPTQGTCSVASGLHCDLGRLAAGGNAVVLVISQVAPDAGGRIVNTSTVTGGQVDPTPEDNSSSATVEVDPLTPAPLAPPPGGEAPVVKGTATQAVADLAVVKHVDRATAKVGGRLTYTLRVTNRGPDDAIGVRLADSWTLGLRVVSVHPSQGSCGKGAPLQCSLGQIESGAQATVTVVAIAKRAGRLKNTAVVASAARDPDQSNDSSTAESVIEAPRKPPPPVVTG
ncbi:MAG TPA: DUF11 domain-containing protein [Solirubrobacterales bacterium]|nr:DUF11 domain-containing protein [Solirubrobacterales bacterium]